VFDWKRNYRDLLSVPDCKDLLIFTVGRDVCGFRFNPLIPPPGTPATLTRIHEVAAPEISICDHACAITAFSI